MVLWWDRLCPVWDATQCVGELSMWLGRLNKDGDLKDNWGTWLKNQEIDQESKQHPKRASHENSSNILNSSLKQALIKRRSKPTTTTRLGTWSLVVIQFIWVKNGFYLAMMIGLHQAYKLDFTLLLWSLIGILMTILYSKIAKVSL
jgi:uncharacterized membrane protein YsdA (DUF1294 family)